MGGQVLSCPLRAITVRTCGCSCGRRCTGSRSSRGCRFHRKLPQFCGVLPSRQVHSCSHGHSSSAPCCSGSNHDRRCYGCIHIYRLNAAMRPQWRCSKRPFSVHPFSGGNWQSTAETLTIKPCVIAPSKPPVLPQTAVNASWRWFCLRQYFTAIYFGTQ